MQVGRVAVAAVAASSSADRAAVNGSEAESRAAEGAGWRCWRGGGGRVCPVGGQCLGRAWVELQCCCCCCISNLRPLTECSLVVVFVFGC